MEEEAILGTCLLMCPVQERQHREREGLLHELEVDCDFISSARSRRKADPFKVIKCFSRSAAGQTTPQPSELRPGPILLKTVNYLLNEIVPLWKTRPLDLYDFVTDRLRAVRQDMTIQRLPPEQCIPLLEPMVKFHLLFGYLLASHQHFEVTLNDRYLNESLARVLDCYPHVSPKAAKNQTQLKIIYCCLNILNPEQVVKTIAFESESMVALQLLVAWTTNNYHRCFAIISRLDLLACAALARHVPLLQRRALTTFCHAMSSANSAYSAEKIADLLLYNSVEHVLEECRRLGIKYSDGMLRFHKKDLLHVNIPTTIITQRWFLIDQSIPIVLSHVLLDSPR